MRARHTRTLPSMAEVFAMPMVRVSAVLLGMLLACRPLSAQQPGIPANIDAGVFAGDVRALLRLSETFRAQCERIAAAPRARVRIEIVSELEGGRAQTTMHRSPRALDADVLLVFGENYRELLAHELEHVIEQLDGVDLRREAAEGRAWEVAAGTFETRRALLVGVQVLHEAESMLAHPAAALPAR